jgi:HTH-type transcriptional regulator/antitoxin HigA
MVIQTKFRLTGKQRDSYLELVQVFPLTSIRSNEHLEAAQAVIDELLAKGALDDGWEGRWLVYEKMGIRMELKM